ncbi:MAG TPA: hypothetical protein VKY36_02035 [Moheibacter sp.]|nr:hypothetical protein [Moheibacter sp.]
MKNYFLSAVFAVSSFAVISAQELQSVNYTTNEINESGLSLSENWRTVLDGNQVLIYNGNIKNSSSKNVKNINVELYLTPQNLTPSAGVINGYHLTKVPFSAISKNGSLVGVNIKSEIQEAPPAGLYDPVLILTDSKGKVLAYQKVTNVLESKDGKLTLVNIQEELPNEKKPDLHPVVQMDIDEDNSIALEKEWKVEVDFQNFIVKVIGGDISNKSSEDLNNLVLDVFLTKENQTQIDSNFDAVHIASAELTNKIESFKKFVDTTVTTNLTRIPENGTYHILLTLSVKDEKGKPVVRTKRAFLDTISF